MEYPEHEKMKAVKAESQAIGEFLEWLRSRNVILCEYVEGRNFPQHHELENKSEEKIIAEYFGIDLKKIDAEKQAMLDSLRADA